MHRGCRDLLLLLPRVLLLPVRRLFVALGAPGRQASGTNCRTEEAELGGNKSLTPRLR